MKDVCFGNDFLDLLDEMRMTGEKQNLVRRAKFSKCVEGVAAAAGIEVDKNVIENDRQGVHMICIFANQRQPHRQIELLGGTAAQNLRRNSDAVSALNLDFTTVERGNHAHVAAIRHNLEKRCSLAQHLRLPCGYVDLRRLPHEPPPYRR